MQSTAGLIAEIREVLDTGGQVDQDRLVYLAEQYARAVSQIHKKSIRCRDLLNSGMRNKAIRVAKHDGDLKEDFEQVDFQDAPTWLDLCERVKLVIPYLLDTDAVNSVIEDIYDSSQNLDRTLKMYRRMSIGRAPIADRLGKLREIYHEDPGSDFWQEDVRTFEEARIEEIARLAERADKDGDLETLERLLAEACSDLWMEDPTSKFVKGLQDLIQPHRQQAANKRYERLIGKVHAAQSRMDEDACRVLLDHWRDIAEETGCPPKAEDAAEIEPVEGWLAELEETRAEEEAFQQACAELETHLDGNEDINTLEKLAAAVLRFDRDMPQLLAARFNSRTEELKRAAKRKFAVRLTAVVGGVLLVAAGVTVSLWWYVGRQELKHWEEQISASLRREDLAGTRALLDELGRSNPSIRGAPEIQGLARELNAKLAAERGRRTMFADLIATAEDPAYARSQDRDPWILEKVERLAKTYDEKLRAQKARERIEEFERRARQEILNTFLRRRGQLGEAYSRVQAAYEEDGQDFPDLANGCLKLARALRDTPKVSAQLKSTAAGIEKGVLSLRSKWNTRVLQRAEAGRTLDLIQTLYATPKKMAEAAREFRLKFPTHPAAEKLRDCIPMAPHWESAAAWYDIAVKWGRAFDVTKESEAEKRLKAIADYLRSHPGGVHTAFAQEYLTYVHAAKKAWASGSLRHLTETRELLASPLLSNLNVLVTKDGRCYYLKSAKMKPVLVAESDKVPCYSVEYIVDANLSTRTTIVWGDKIREMPKAAPQNAFAKRAMESVGLRLKESDWPTIYLGLAEMTRAEREMDPILKANLLKIFISYACDCTWGSAEDIQKSIEVLDNIDVDLPWMNPHDEGAKGKRAQIRNLLASIHPLTSFIRDAEKRKETLRLSFCAYKPVGMLVDGKDHVKIKPVLLEGELYVIWADADEAPTWIKIGAVVNGKVRIDEEKVKPYPWGTLIFVKSSRAI